MKIDNFTAELEEILMVLHRNKVSVGRAKAHAKVDKELASASKQILLDNLRANGIDPDTKQGLTVLKLIIARRLSKLENNSGYKADFNFDEPGGSDRSDW
jgi:hypothetical protein